MKNILDITESFWGKKVELNYSNDYIRVNHIGILVPLPYPDGSGLGIEIEDTRKLPLFITEKSEVEVQEESHGMLKMRFNDNSTLSIVDFEIQKQNDEKQAHEWKTRFRDKSTLKNGIEYYKGNDKYEELFRFLLLHQEENKLTEDLLYYPSPKHTQYQISDINMKFRIEVLHEERIIPEYKPPPNMFKIRILAKWRGKGELLTEEEIKLGGCVTKERLLEIVVLLANQYQTLL